MSGATEPHLQSEADQRLAQSDQSEERQQVSVHELSAGVGKATEDAIRVRKAEMRNGKGYSRARLILTLTHKYGHSMEDAKAAADYVKGPRVPNNVQADRLPSFGQMPPFTASHRLAAAEAEVMEAARIMARPTRVSKVADEGLQKITNTLLDLGYEYKVKKNKAFYTKEFFKEGEASNAPVFEVVGWHGTGSFAGGERAILEFYDDQHSKDRPVVSIGVINEENINPAKQLEVITHIMDYLKHHG